jgi:uncharacterized protein (TIGR03437 family)
MFARRCASCVSISILAFAALRAQERRITGPIDDAVPAVVHGSLHAKAQSRYDQGRVEGSLPIPFVTLTMKPSAAQQAALERLLEDQQDRSSPNYRRWLTPEEFGDSFGLASNDYAAIRVWLESHHLRIEQVARARNWMTFSGAARDVEKAFHTEIHRYLINGESHIANASYVSVPAALQGIIDIRGLDDFWRLPRAAVPENTSASGVHQLAPGDWATIYDVSPLYAMGIDGTGQRIGILGRSDMNQSYIDQFRSQFALPPTTIEKHLVGPDPGITNAAGEAALDLEWSGAIARGATIVYIYSGNFNDSAQAAIDQNLASVISESFGTCEPQGGVGSRLMAQQANAQGITWVASSGDSGAAGCDPHGFFNTTGNATTVSDGSAVSIPASFPEVTAVGGTQFNEVGAAYWAASNGANGGSALSYIPEVVWNETGAGGLLASGGGASLYFPKPAWQAGPGVPSDNFRDVPDIAFSAAGNHDPYIVVNANGQRATGGTSAGAPSFAGVVALLNHYLVSQGAPTQPGLANINADLYRLARTTTGIFHDITQGDNIVPCAAGSPGCVNGGMGVAAGPGYDLATGLGSIDVYNLVTQWNTSAARTTVSLTASPAAIAFGGSTQLTAVVSPAASSTTTPSGTVMFTAGRAVLGTASLVNVAGVAMATLSVGGNSLPAGNANVTASYAGDANFGASSGSAMVAVSAGPEHSSVSVNITPNPAHEGQFITVTLREEAGVATTITGWTINGNDDFSLFAPDFGGTSLPPFGTLSATITSARPANLPSPRVYVFTGQDADGRNWSQQYTLSLEGPLQTPGISMLSAPATVQQNPSADPACQWSQQLIVQENLGFGVQLTRLLAGGVDWTPRMQQLFGSTRLAALGMLQARVCWPGPTAPPPTQFEVDGTDETGVPVSSTFQASYTGAVASASALAAAQSSMTLRADTGPTAAGGNLTVNFAGTGGLNLSVLPANRSTSWIAASAQTSSHQVTLQASAAGLAPGVYSVTLLIQAADAVPQFVEVPVVFLVGASSSTAIDHIANGASFQPAFAPGMVLSVFGSQLAPSVQTVSAPPLPATLAGVSATVNGIPASFYYASPSQLNIQIPYEAGSGPAVLGVNNNGQVASFLFTIAPAAPGIFSDYSHGGALVPFSSGKRGDTLMLFMTGEGQVSPALANGATPFVSTLIGLLPEPVLPVAVTVGGVPAQILFAGVPSGLTGASQINFTIPTTAPTGVQPVVVNVAGVSSPAVSLRVNP